jgi:pilus assembly protein CpaE
MSAYFLSSQPNSSSVVAVEQKIRAVLPDLRTIETLDEIAQHISGSSAGKIVVVFVAPTIERENIDNLIAIASQHHERVFFVLISNEISATDYKRLVRTEGADWVSTNGAAQEVLDIIAAHNLPARPASEGHQRPVVVSFVPSAGGVGNTTIAIEVGVYLKSQKAGRSRRICCVDLDFQNSDMCDYLDIEARLQIQEIADHPERLDAQLFSVFVSRHASGLDVIAAPRTKSDVCDIAVGALDALFEMIAHRYDLVLVDLPVAWFSWTSPVIANSDAAVVTGINTIPCLRQIAETLEAVRNAKRETAGLAVVINRCKRGLFGGVARRQHVEAVLGGQKLFYIGEDSAALDSVNTGQPMVSSAASGKTKAELSAVALFCAELRSPTPMQVAPRRP